MQKFSTGFFRINQFRKQENGLSTVEFALVAPFLLLLLFGSAALFDHLVAKRRIISTTDSLADVTARVVEIDTASANTMFDVATLMLGKYATDTDLSMKVTGWRYDSVANHMEVAWSRARGAGISADTVGTTVGRNVFPRVRNGEMIVEAELTFDYRSPFYMLPGGNTFRGRAMRRPRYIGAILDLDATP